MSVADAVLCIVIDVPEEKFQIRPDMHHPRIFID